MRWRWAALGSLAILGGLYLYVRLLTVLQIWPPYGAFIGFSIAGVLGGAAMARHALIVPWREPVVAALGASAVVIGFWALEPWMVGRIVGELPAVLLSGGLMIGGCIGGAALARRMFGTAPTAVASALLNVLLLGGILIIILAVATTLGATRNAFIPPVLVGVALAGFLTQAVTPVKSIWACSAGSIVLVLIMLTGAGPIGSSVAGLVLLWLAGAAGAALAWRVLPQPEPTADVPPARLQ